MNDNSNSSTLEPVPEGFRTRLRYGNNKRDRFTIKLKDAQQAERRRKALQSIANTLAKAGKHTEAPIILRKGAEVTTEREFQEVDVEQCPNCSGRLKLRALVIEAYNIARLWFFNHSSASLRHLGEPLEPPKRAPARDPP